MSYTNRDEIPAKYKWDLTPLMQEDHWEVEFNETMAALPKVAEFKGKLGDKASLKAYFELADDIELHFERLYVYANLKMHEDAKIAKFREMVARISMAAAELGGAFAWVNPEIIATYSEKELLALADDPDFFAHRSPKSPRYWAVTKTLSVCSTRWISSTNPSTWTAKRWL